MVWNVRISLSLPSVMGGNWDVGFDTWEKGSVLNDVWYSLIVAKSMGRRRHIWRMLLVAGRYNIAMCPTAKLSLDTYH